MPKEKKTVAGEHHPRSRRAEQVFRKTNRTARMDKKKQVTEKKQSQKAKICKWVKSNLEDGKQCYSVPEIHALIGKFLEERTADYQRKKEQNKVSTTLELQHHALLKAYNEAHFEMPDLTQPKVVQELRKWDGNIKFLQNFKLSGFSNPNPLKAAWEQVNAEKKQAQNSGEKMQISA